MRKVKKATTFYLHEKTFKLYCMPKTYTWGIIGPGTIAKKFTEALQLTENVWLGVVAIYTGVRYATLCSRS